MNSITLNGKVYSGPSSWQEVTRDQVLIWVKILSKNLSPDHGFLLAAILFYGFPKRLFFKLNAVQQYEITKTLGFLWENSKMVNWFIPYFRIYGLKYIGPDHRLSNSTIKEFRFCELYYNLYKKSGDEKLLDLLVATLYRRPGKNDAGNDLRCSLTDIKVRAHAGRMKRLGDPVRKAILFNYEGCSSYIKAKYPLVFKVSKSKAKNEPVADLEELIKTVAGGKFGSFKETENTPLYLFLDHLSQYIEESEKTRS